MPESIGPATCEPERPSPRRRRPLRRRGASGVGAYHGEWGFRTFSKEKPVFLQSRLNGIGLLHPPYGKTFDRMLSLLKRIA